MLSECENDTTIHIDLLQMSLVLLSVRRDLRRKTISGFYLLVGGVGLVPKMRPYIYYLNVKVF